MRGRLVVVEGLDFAGKTTAGRLALEELSARGEPAIYNTAKERRLRRVSKQLAVRRGVPTIVPDILFLVAVLYDTARIARRLRRGVTVVQDRYYSSYVWNHLAIPRSARRLSTLPLYRLLRPLFLEPDVVLYCRCSPRVLRERYKVQRRSAPTALSPNDLVVFAQESHLAIESYESAFAEALAGVRGVVSIDNDGPIEQLAGAVRVALAGGAA